MATENTPPPEVEPRHRLRMLLRNPVSLAGMALAIVSLANIFLFVLIDQIAPRRARISEFWLTWSRRRF